MAVDEALLIDAAENGIATLRFYQWEKPTLSLGYFQRYGDRSQHAASKNCVAVRRQTGGGAILHDQELTYSLTLPARHPLSSQNQQLYVAVHEAFIELFKMPLVALSTYNSEENRYVSLWTFARHDPDSQLNPKDEPFLCFQRRARGDVILTNRRKDDKELTGENLRSWKVLGSAQRRYRGAILQHGSLLLQTSPAAPELTGLNDLLNLVEIDDFWLNMMTFRIGLNVELDVEIAELPLWVQLEARELANTKYGSEAWTKRR
jgi:lipoate-protein ligase A